MSCMFPWCRPCAIVCKGGHEVFQCRQKISSARRRRRQQRKLHGIGSTPGLIVHCLLRADYAATASDSSVLQRPLKEELLPEEVHNVFDYPRNLNEKCAAALPAHCSALNPASSFLPKARHSVRLHSYLIVLSNDHCKTWKPQLFTTLA